MGGRLTVSAYQQAPSDTTSALATQWNQPVPAPSLFPSAYTFDYLKALPLGASAARDPQPSLWSFCYEDIGSAALPPKAGGEDPSSFWWLPAILAVLGRKTPIARSALDKNPMPGHPLEGNPVDEGTTRRGIDTPVHRPEKPTGSTHSSTRGLSPRA